ncbi:hypothetical protein [Photorhabdus sp. RW14-46]|uniref:hypothetical protein n=1 Tax=Photorhabdus sp. RW14-46 TaxID=2100168 RepID=UPI0013F4236B|nr:hypothetical protein [Photorhabdus sp. RW14-46]NHB63190.1 hypothetical protein [Photorhabdus sp. RW14-46]
MKQSFSSVSPGQSPFGVRKSSQTIIAESKDERWVQLQINVDLFENVGATTLSGAGRCIKINTAGTMINTSSFRGLNEKPVDVLAYSIQDRIGMETEDVNNLKVKDNKNIFDDCHITIQPIDSSICEYDYSQSSPKFGLGSDWYLSEYSPRSKNKDNNVETSTGSGLSAGMFGGIPTIGIDVSESNAKQWSLPDYDLAGMAALSDLQQPRIVWNIQRSDKKADPLIARSSFNPIFEGLFALRPEAKPSRYSTFAILLDFSFVKNEHHTTDDEFIKKSLPFGGVLDYLFNNSMLKHIVPEFGSDKYFFQRFSFLTKFVVDWHLGTVSGISDSSIKGRHDQETLQLVKLKSLLQEKDEHSSGFLSKEKSINYLNSAPIEIESSETYLEFAQDSAIGIATLHNLNDPEAGNYELIFPASVLAGLYNNFNVYTNYPLMVDNAKSVTWLPFKNAARIQVPHDNGIPEGQFIDGFGKFNYRNVWVCPTGYNRDFVWYLNNDLNNKYPFKKSAMAILNIPEVPDSYYATHIKRDDKYTDGIEFLVFRDRVFYFLNGKLSAYHNSCLSFLTSAVMDTRSPVLPNEKTRYSIGIAQGRLFFSKDILKTVLSEDESNELTVVTSDQNKKHLQQVLNDFIFGCANPWIFMCDDDVYVVRYDDVVTFKMPTTKCSTKLTYFQWHEGATKYFKNKLLVQVASSDVVAKQIAGWSAGKSKPAAAEKPIFLLENEVIFQKSF